MKFFEKYQFKLFSALVLSQFDFFFFIYILIFTDFEMGQFFEVNILVIGLIEQIHLVQSLKLC